MAKIEETSTITSKGQTTVPKAVRQALGVDYGGTIAFRIEGNRVTVHRAASVTERRDPALAAFLDLIERDIAAARQVDDLPAGVVAAMRRARKAVPVDLDEPLEGDVAL
jgi:antitoxin PrlF